MRSLKGFAGDQSQVHDILDDIDIKQWDLQSVMSHRMFDKRMEIKIF